MHLTRFHLFLLGGLMMVVIGPVVFSQPDPSQRRQGDNGWAGRPRQDPDTFWNQVAPGKDSVNVNELQLPPELAFRADRLKGEWLAFLQKKGITTGVMTKSLYRELSEERQREREARRAAFQNDRPADPVVAAKEKESVKPTASAPSSPDSQDEDAKIEEEARRWFASLDVNKDGVIDREEARPVRMLRNFERYDLNFDDKISVEEFIEAYRDDQGRRGRGSRAIGGAFLLPSTEAPVEEERRSVVYRVGKLPKELPPWFGELDRDKDGQVGLYEWKAAGRSIPEFLAMDVNRDGFLTAEEVLRFQKAQRKTGVAKDGRVGRGTSGAGPVSMGGVAGPSQGDTGTPVGTIKLPERLRGFCREYRWM